MIHDHVRLQFLDTKYVGSFRYVKVIEKFCTLCDGMRTFWTAHAISLIHKVWRFHRTQTEYCEQRLQPSIEMYGKIFK